jgi:hypothetical protein
LDEKLCPIKKLCWLSDIAFDAILTQHNLLANRKPIKAAIVVTA